MKKFSLQELAEEMPVLDMLETAYFVGGGSGTPTDPYTYWEFNYACNQGNFEGGYVLDLDDTIRRYGPVVTCYGEGYGGYGAHSGDYAAILANSYIGMNETNGYSVIAQMFSEHTGYSNGNQNDPWCAAFVSTVLDQAGINSPGSAAVNDYRNWGNSVSGNDVKVGDVAIFRGQNISHVGIVTEVHDDGTVTVVHGNSSNQVKQSIMNKSSFDFRRGN